MWLIIVSFVLLSWHRWRSWHGAAHLRAFILKHLFGVVDDKCRHLRRAKKLAKQRRTQRKPDWAREEVIRLAVHLRSCRPIANAFNRLHGHRETICHETVRQICLANQARIDGLRRDMRRRAPRTVPVGKLWALDLTLLATRDGRKLLVLGIIDHGSRCLLHLKVLPRKCTWTLLAHVCMAIAEHGMPGKIRTDNEAMFTSKAWRLAFKLAGIWRQRSQPGCPWQNGCIERLFGTLKWAMRQLILPAACELQARLDEFAAFYNHVRPHQNLGGLTPVEAWNGDTWLDVQRRAGQGQWVEALDGTLRGYHLRC